MDCVGIDVGAQTSLFAAPKAGGIEVLLNDYSQRQTASVVAFGDKTRSMGESGKQKMVIGYKNTVAYFTSLVGRQYSSPDVQQMLKTAYFKHEAMADGTVGAKVMHNGEQKVFNMTQILGMLLSHLKQCTEASLAAPVADCVLGVPCSYNDAQRQAMLDACEIANLNCLRLFNETTAVALAYGIYKKDLPETAETPRRVVFADFGHSNLQLSLCDLVKGKLKMVTTKFAAIGGQDFDAVLLQHMAKLFKEKTKLDVFENPRAVIRLRSECEKLKKNLSANSTDLPLNIECLMEERDFSARLNRADFEELAREQFDRISAAVNEFVADLSGRGIELSAIHSVEIVGGGRRIPLFQKILAEAFGQEPSRTLDAEEAVGRGCALMAAMVSPKFRVREFKVEDVTPYAINLSWKTSSNGDGFNALYTPNSSSHVAKIIQFNRSSPFELQASYANPDQVADAPQTLGTFAIDGVTPSYDGKDQLIKVKVKVDQNGCFCVESAVMMETLPPEPEVEAEPEAKPAGEASMDTTSDTPAGESADTPMDTETDKAEASASEEAEKAPTKEKKEAEPKQKKAKKTALTVTTTKPWLLSDAERLVLVEMEGQLTLQDAREREKHDARNALEEYVYEMRDKLLDMYQAYISESDGDAFKSKLSATEEWLYDEEDVSKKVYIDKLQDLKMTGDVVETRYQEWETRPKAVEALQHSIVILRKFVDAQAAGDEAYSHLTEEDMTKVSNALSEKEAWLNEKVAAQAALSKADNPAVTTAELKAKLADLEKVCNPIMNKPKPKEEPPKEDPSKEEPKPEATEEAAVPEGDGEQPPATEEEKASSGPADLD
eukprot:m.352552 g.352552  ORF g.352552 m.352552 type:complete len:833 (+) comp16551_c0_seq1:542-3040(+)